MKSSALCRSGSLPSASPFENSSSALVSKLNKPRITDQFHVTAVFAGGASMSSNSQNQNSVFQFVSFNDRVLTLNVGRSRRMMPAKHRMHGHRMTGPAICGSPMIPGLEKRGCALATRTLGTPPATSPCASSKPSPLTAPRASAWRGDAAWSYPANIWAALVVARAVRG